MFSFFSEAHAEAAATIGGTGTAGQQPQGMVAQLAILAVFVLVFWLLIWRPQSKRNKEHKNLLDNLTKGDEVTTTGGISGKITRINDNFVTLLVNDNTEINFQKHSIVSALPKGTLNKLKTK
jgi:preprotein translocase subunit YajC